MQNSPQAPDALLNTVFSQEDFLHGTPERIFSATKKPKILIVWPHGNEELGPRFGYHLYSQRPDLLEHVDYLCGNPSAAATQASARSVGADLNRSYDPQGEPTGYEQLRAQEILSIIKDGGYDYVLDLHTSVTDVDRFIIIKYDTPLVRRMIAASPITRIIIMPASIADASLAGQAANSLTLEYNQDFAETPQAMAEVTQLVEALIDPAKASPKNREFFYVDRTIPKTEDPGLDTRNFELCKDGYYPVLLGVGEVSYRNDPSKTYLGFAATRKEDVIL